MYIVLAVLFLLICWVVGLLFFINFGIAQPQYGPKKLLIKHMVFFWTGLAVLFIALPGFGFYLAV